jgi:hypothetical protein
MYCLGERSLKESRDTQGARLTDHLTECQVFIEVDRSIMPQNINGFHHSSPWPNPNAKTLSTPLITTYNLIISPHQQ